MFNIFGSDDQTEVEIKAPLTGEIVALEEVPDEVFAAKTVGDGVAIKPTKNKLVAPAEGVIRQLFPTGHAVGIETEAGVELLIHIGVDTVDLDGEGFEKLAQEGDQIKAGDELIKFNLDYIAEQAPSTITPVVITNVDQMVEFTVAEAAEVTAGEDKLLTITVDKN